MSLKFLDDLCTAYAWLQAKGYSLETISEYTAILWYGEPPATGFPPPLIALGVPEDALKGPGVDENALGHFVTARTFIILHEMGHIPGKRGDLATLAPRRPGELPHGPIEAGPTNRGILFNGLYPGRFAQYSNPKEDMAIKLVLKRNGDKVQGTYSFGSGVGKLEGAVVKQRLYFDWEWAGN